MTPAAIRTLFSEDDIASRLAALSADIVGTLQAQGWLEQPFVALAVMQGGFVFSADLIRRLEKAGVSPRLDFLTVKSYGCGMRSSGAPVILHDMITDVSGKNVLVIDDILDSGHTLSFVRNLLRARGARDVKAAILLEKQVRHVEGAVADFVGFRCPDCFVVGYGMDLAQRYRGLPFIGVLDIAVLDGDGKE
jgi:hypoxanthine phosphoribosyltransferase